ncbi:MAG: glycerol-3-phosphate ABC transporter ATP-binding protein [Candidatus Marinimicrobia bacterium]|nr:glycerol-3-phosphate ABC transporter ATP-binding protein [Candidatus Neomarinimicrobiota bacterium]|tara:strand:+ start:7223 stop:8344 length:1122 start_codon:yes stop_codon:yes gene_type:complete
MSSIKLSGVSKIFQSQSKKRESVKAVDNFNLDIKDGELLVLLGPSGCGKTTVLRMVAGLEVPTTGDILIGEKVVTDLHSKDRGIAMVFQDYALYPHMTVRENMSFGLENLKYLKNEIDKRVNDTSKLLDLEPLLDRRPKELSGGQRQRVALGRAIVRKPEVYLFDEPLSNLDAKLRLKMRVELGSLQKDLGVTSIYVTHDQVEAMTLGERIVIMNNGVLQQVGTPKQIYDKPANLFVAGFIGAPPMNFLDSTLKKDKDNYIVDLEGSHFPLLENRNFEKYENKKIVIGIRPNDLSISTNKNENSFEFVSGIVNVVEYLGNSNLVYINTNNNSICVEQSSHIPVTQGEKIVLYADQNNIHLFDSSDNGNSILKD